MRARACVRAFDAGAAAEAEGGPAGPQKGGPLGNRVMIITIFVITITIFTMIMMMVVVMMMGNYYIITDHKNNRLRLNTKRRSAEMHGNHNDAFVDGCFNPQMTLP